MQKIVKLEEIGAMVLRTPLEMLEDEKINLPDTNWFSLKYFFTAVRFYIQTTCFQIVEHPMFEFLSLACILTNCVFLALYDPRQSEQPQWQTNADYAFQGIYTTEILIKTLAHGFIFNEGAFLRNYWNIMDFLVVFFGYLSYLQFSTGVDLKSLRTFRVLRPLRMISSVEGLRLIMEAIISSLPLIGDILLILSFYFVILAIAALQLWNGILKARCFYPQSGFTDDTRCCGSHVCNAGADCVNYISNPNYGGTNYDTVFASLLTAFQCVTLESWSNVEQNVADAFGPASTIYFTFHTLFGAFFLMNFFLAVIKSRVSATYEESRKTKQHIISQELTPEELQKQAEKKKAMLNILKSNKRAKNKEIEEKLNCIEFS